MKDENTKPETKKKDESKVHLPPKIKNEVIHVGTAVSPLWAFYPTKDGGYYERYSQRKFKDRDAVAVELHRTKAAFRVTTAKQYEAALCNVGTNTPRADWGDK